LWKCLVDAQRDDALDAVVADPLQRDELGKIAADVVRLAEIV
jgi:hypothetical protein